MPDELIEFAAVRPVRPGSVVGMARAMISDTRWTLLFGALATLGIRATPGLRKRLEAILWRMRTGAPWRDLPEFLGPWSSAYNQFNRWSKRGIWDRLFALVCGELDHEWSFMDGTIVRAHQHAAGARKGEDAAIGRSRGGLTTKIHMLADAHGNPASFEITEGQVHDMKRALALLEKCAPGTVLIDDKGYDSEPLREAARAKGITPCIPKRRGSSRPNPEFDRHLYKLRHLVENLFAKLKAFRALATRYDKLKRNYAAVVCIACAWLWLGI